VTPNNIVVMSLGCGNYPISIKSEDEEDPNKDLDWGIKDWVRITPILSRGSLGRKQTSASDLVPTGSVYI